jgi:hypothetical protein
MANPDWKPFEPATFEVARSQDRPVLLVLTAPWCAHCKDLLATTFADQAVVDAVQQHFVPVLADAERRPDVNERFGSGGWPTIAYLTPGGELIGNDFYLSAEQLLPQLQRVAEHYRRHRTEIESGLKGLLMQKSAAEQRRPRGRLTARVVEDVADAICDKFDHRFGGWGESAKFPHSEALDFALVQIGKRQDPRMKEVVTVTLDRMLEGRIHDPIDGGFFRYSRTPDWNSPDYEKVLDANSQRLRVFLEAYQLFGKETYRQAAEGILRWLEGFMHDAETGCFFGSQDADAEYYAQDDKGRRARRAPRLDRTIYANWNAMTISAVLKASVVLGRVDLRDVASRALAFLLENLVVPSPPQSAPPPFPSRIPGSLWSRGAEVYHYWDGTYHLPGMLSDQAYLIRALLDASQHSGDADLLLPAEAIAESVIARQRAPGGGFWDIQGDTGLPGSMRRRNRSILENSVMAEALVRLSYLSRRPELHAEAVRTLEAFTSDYKEYGYYVAGYGRAVDLIFYEPLQVTIVGDRTSAAADRLRRAALSCYMPSRIVQMLDPKHDPILIGRGGYPPAAEPTVYLSVGRTTKAVTKDPDELLAAMNRIEGER